jgi:hypothetical protein
VPFDLDFSTFDFPVVHQTKGEQIALLRVATLDDVGIWEKTWQPVLREKGQYDGEWPWHEHIEHALEHKDALCLAVIRGEELDALASFRIQRSTSRLEGGKDLIYIEYVGTAPWHQPPPVGELQIRGLGKMLLRLAVNLSKQLGLEGRVGLHSKKEVEGFYRKIGMHEVKREDTGDGTWLYFETGPAEAEELLKGI